MGGDARSRPPGGLLARWTHPTPSHGGASHPLAAAMLVGCFPRPDYRIRRPDYRIRRPDWTMAAASLERSVISGCVLPLGLTHASGVWSLLTTQLVGSR